MNQEKHQSLRPHHSRWLFLHQSAIMKYKHKIVKEIIFSKTNTGKLHWTLIQIWISYSTFFKIKVKLKESFVFISSPLLLSNISALTGGWVPPQSDWQVGFSLASDKPISWDTLPSTLSKSISAVSRWNAVLSPFLLPIFILWGLIAVDDTGWCLVMLESGPTGPDWSPTCWVILLFWTSECFKQNARNSTYKVRKEKENWLITLLSKLLYHIKRVKRV